MKFLMTALALATLAASPAFAASSQHARHMRAAADNAFASTLDPYTVVQGGQVIGRDPDANVRLQLRSTAGTIGEGGN
jgi:hypothetical protein